MGRPDFARAPQLRELGQELFEALPLWATTQIAGAERGECGLTLTDLMQKFRRIERDEFRPEGFFDGVRD
jgi:hypothetical protein